MNKKYSALFLLALLSIITFLDRNAISIAGERITQEMGLTEDEFGWILSAFTFAYCVFEIPSGMLGDSIGAKKVLARIVLWWSLFTALTGMTGGFASLFIVRFLFGAGEAGAYPNTAISIKEWFSGTVRGRAQAVIWMASRLGGALAPFIVIPLQVNFGWRVSFYVLGVVGLVWVVVWLIWYKDKERGNAVKDYQSYSFLHLKKWVRRKNFWLLVAMYYCYVSGVFFFISWLPKYLQNGRGIAENELAWAASFPFLLSAAGCMMGGSLSDALVKRMGLNRGRRIVPMTGLLLSGICMVLAALITNNFTAVILLGFGLACMDVTAPVAWTVASGISGKDSGTVTGAMNTAGILGGTVTSVGIGYLITIFHSYNLPVIVMAVFAIISACLWLWIKADEKVE